MIRLKADVPGVVSAEFETDPLPASRAKERRPEQARHDALARGGPMCAMKRVNIKEGWYYARAARLNDAG